MTSAEVSLRTLESIAVACGTGLVVGKIPPELPLEAPGRLSQQSPASGGAGLCVVTRSGVVTSRCRVRVILPLD
jgi:hypothetical protein